MNPNTDWGIVRGTFDLTLLNKNDGVIAVAGSGGVPGASCCTLYQIPPGGRYLLADVASGKQAVNTAAVEIRIKTGWVEWSEVVDPPSVKILTPRLRVRYGFGTVSGRLEISGNGVYNVYVTPVIEGKGPSFSTGWNVVDCVSAGDRVAFSVDLFALPSEAKLDDVVAYVTTIPGVGDIDTPPGCQ